MTLLALETATVTCGVAVLEDHEIKAQAHLQRPRVHSERVTPLIEDVLAHADRSSDELDAIAVSMGPGSYTGLRIGVSTAKGWSLAADAPLVGVPTLEAFAAQLSPVATRGDVVCPLLDARRDEVYAGAYRIAADGLVEHASTKALPTDALADWLAPVDGRLWLVGDGAEKSVHALDGVGGEQTVVSDDEVSPSAAWVARRGRHILQEDGPDDRASFEPFYVKDVHATPASSPFE